jgi:hypothetical protein
VECMSFGAPQSYMCAEPGTILCGACRVIHTGNKRGKLSFAEARYFNPDELARLCFDIRTCSSEPATESHSKDVELL